MFSRCREPLAGVLAMLLWLGGCAREERRFADDPPGAPKNISAPSPYDGNAYAISQGKRLFDSFNCSGCHAHGGGDIGPALMDERWIYGGEPANLFATVTQGRPNGMPAFRDHLTNAQVWQLVAYVRSLTGQLRRDVLPSRNDHLFDKPGEQSLESPQ